jgi:hypothetical protein
MSHTVLVVDDSPVIRHAVRSFIEQTPHWHVCGEAENGKVAVEQVRELHPDVVILDLQMPVMDGLRGRPPHQPACPQHRNADVYDARWRSTLKIRSGSRYQGSALKIRWAQRASTC